MHVGWHVLMSDHQFDGKGCIDAVQPRCVCDLQESATDTH